MSESTFVHRAPRLAVLSSFLLSVACAPAATSDAATPVRDAGVAVDRDAHVDPTHDAGPPSALTDAAGADSGTADSGGTAEEDAGSPIATTDAGTPSAVWRPFTDASPWNTPIAADAPMRSDSAALIDHLSTSSAWPGLSVSIDPWSVPLYYVDSSVPLVPVHAGLSNEGAPHTFMWPVPADAEPAPELDGHLLLVDRATGRSYDFYQASRAGGGGWECTLCATSDLNGSGVRPPKGGPTPWYESHGSRACGFPLAAGLVRVEEIRAGRIEHALVLGYPGIRQRWFTSPASTGHPANGIVSPDRGIPCGGRVQLDPSLDLGSLGLSPAARVIARALQEYGAYVGDFSGSINVYADGSPDARASWSSGDLLSTDDLSGIPLERMRVVEWGTLTSDG